MARDLVSRSLERAAEVLLAVIVVIQKVMCCKSNDPLTVVLCVGILAEGSIVSLQASIV